MLAVFALIAMLACIPAAIAKSKGRSFGVWWLYGFLILPIALIHSLAASARIEDKDHQARLSGLRKCPYCAEFIRPDAIVCKHCGRELPKEGEFPKEVEFAKEVELPEEVELPTEVAAVSNSWQTQTEPTRRRWISILMFLLLLAGIIWWGVWWGVWSVSPEQARKAQKTVTNPTFENETLVQKGTLPSPIAPVTPSVKTSPAQKKSAPGPWDFIK
jgi:hypothetical protein